jgi:hypothetical protein
MGVVLVWACSRGVVADESLVGDGVRKILDADLRSGEPSSCAIGPVSDGV